MKVYLAGSLFTQAERRWNRQVADVLRQLDPNLEVFLPQDATAPAVQDNDTDFEKVFQICLRGVSQSDAVLAILDGSDADSGTSFECGYAFALGIPVLGVRTDLRSSEDRGLNAMLSQSCTDLVHFPSANEDISELAGVILRKLRGVMQHARKRSTAGATSSS